MIRITYCPCFIAVAISCLIGACASPKWAVNTYYVIKDVDKTASSEDVGAIIRKRIQSEILEVNGHPRALRVLSSSEIAEATAGESAIGFMIEGAGIPNMKTLSKIQKIIVQVSSEQKVPVALNSGAMRFQSIGGKGEAEFVIEGSATAGSMVLLDDGSGNIKQASIDEEGNWRCDIQKNPGLAARNGMVYAKIKKNDAVLLLEISILSNSKRNISIEELPQNSPLR